MFGYTAEEAVGKHITLIVPEDRLDEERNILARLRHGEGSSISRRSVAVKTAAHSICRSPSLLSKIAQGG